MSPASVQPHIPSFPAIPAKTKAEEAAFAPCRMCWGVQSSPTAVPGSREGGPRGFAEAQGQERGAGAQSGRGGLPGGFCSLPVPGKTQPQKRDVAPTALSSPRTLPSPALARGGSTGGAAPGFGNLIRAVPGAGAALGSPAGAGAAEQVWARLLHGSGQFRGPWKRAVSAETGKGPYKHHSKVGTPREAPGAVEGAASAGCAGGGREVRVDVEMARGEGRRAAPLLISLLPHGISMWHYPCCAAGQATLPGNQICTNRMFGPTTSALGSFKKWVIKTQSCGRGLLESAPGDP